MTLIEVTLVISVMLSLIGVLFVGVEAYKRGADRAKCLLNSASVQKAARSHQNLYGLNPGDPMNHVGTIVGPGRMYEIEPVCPKYDAYAWLDVVPMTGQTYIDCHDPNNSPDYHYPQNIAGW